MYIIATTRHLMSLSGKVVTKFDSHQAFTPSDTGSNPAKENKWCALRDCPGFTLSVDLFGFNFKC